ncbi:unnamed protein product [Caenorhabditis angaria]|uniref:Uncharacterized protein n=1 Tax=Caenorhabditis angaria TaxID=860376 RepID=A0A9P1I6V8_9PELO|nr:unnamed protein product [Caenorhabditis angaria]
MITVFTGEGPLDAVFAGKKEKNQKEVFDQQAAINRKEQITYTACGRKLINGEAEEKKDVGSMWNKTLTGGIAGQIKNEATETEYQKARRLLKNYTYDAQVFLRQQYRQNPTPFQIFAIIFAIFLLYKLLF